MLYGSPYGRYGEAAFGGSTSPKDGGSAVSGPSDDMIALEYSLRHLRAGGGDCVGRSIARWSSFMHVSVYLEAESPCQFPVFQTTHFGALVRLLFHELLGLQLRRLLRWSSIGAREGFYLLCSLLLEPCALRRACGQGAVLSLCMVRPGSGRFGVGFWVGFLGGIARAGFYHRESALPDPLNY